MNSGVNWLGVILGLLVGFGLPVLLIVLIHVTDRKYPKETIRKGGVGHNPPAAFPPPMRPQSGLMRPQREVVLRVVIEKEDD